MAEDKGKPKAPAVPAGPVAAAEAAKPAPEAKPKPKVDKKPVAKGKKKISQKWKLYELTADKAKKKRKCCPKCGDGVFLGHHATRDSCGKCGYTEFRKTTTEEKKK
jgi:small subunit ribosomal protein S27Ae